MRKVIYIIRQRASSGSLISIAAADVLIDTFTDVSSAAAVKSFMRAQKGLKYPHDF